jgi:hypothetical protein
MTLYVFELTWPGTWLDDLPKQVAFEVETMLLLLESALADAAVSLELFEAEQAAAAAMHGTARNGRTSVLLKQRWWFDSRVNWRLTCHSRSVGDWTSRYVSGHKLRPSGRAGSRGSSLMPTRIACRSCTPSRACTLDTIAKTLRTLARMPGLPAGVAQARDDFEARFPTLVAIRDSAHHPEDRIRGVRGRAGRETPIATQPILSGAIHAPSGGVIVLDMLDNNRYGGTLADGTYGEVEISAETVAGARQVIQQVVDAFSWRGPASTGRCDGAGRSHAVRQASRHQMPQGGAPHHSPRAF